MPLFDGKEYTGPVGIDGSDVPEKGGVYLICVGSSGGERIIALYAADNMKKSLTENPKRECWNRYAVNNDMYSDGSLRCYYILVENPSERDALITRTVEIRPYNIPCYEAPKDDW